VFLYRYFTDPEGYDAKTIVDGLKIARNVAATAPFNKWLKREVAPGPNVVTDEQLSEYGRRAAHTVGYIFASSVFRPVELTKIVCHTPIRSTILLVRTCFTFVIASTPFLLF
jgi:hypothetical protein